MDTTLFKITKQFYIIMGIYIVYVLSGYNKIKTISRSQQALINGQLTIKDHSTAS